MSYAPIALFVYNRLDHTKATVEALQKNFLAAQSELFVFCDGEKDANGSAAVRAVRDYVKSISGFKNLQIIEKEKNHGLAQSIISGVSEIVEKFGRVIVLEDDMVTAPYFLEFMNDGLNFYESEPEVVSIHGYIYPVNSALPKTFFLRGADCWGWATWKRGWDLFEKDGAKLLQKLQEKNLTKKFDFDGTYHYTKMLEDQIAGKNNSWAIRWYASAFLADKLTLYPGKSLLKNIGIDGSGTHCGDSESFDVEMNYDKIVIEKIEIAESKQARDAVKIFFKPKRSFFAKIKHKITKKIAKLRKK